MEQGRARQLPDRNHPRHFQREGFRNWPLDFGSIALLWRGGCIIRAAFLERIKEAFDADKNLENLLLAPYFRDVLAKAQTAWRHAITTAVNLGIWTPAFMTALAYYDGI